MSFPIPKITTFDDLDKTLPNSESYQTEKTQTEMNVMFEPVSFKHQSLIHHQLILNHDVGFVLLLHKILPEQLLTFEIHRPIIPL